MTAVASQQNGHRQPQNPRQSASTSNMSSQPRPQSYTPSGGESSQRLEAPLLNVNVTPLNHRPAVSNDPVSPNVTKSKGRRGSNSTSKAVADAGDQERRISVNARPTSAPHEVAGASEDANEVSRRKRRPKSLLQRAESDYGPRGEEPLAQEEEIQDWGARHGFEDHYASEEYVSQLANVGCSFPSCACLLRFDRLPRSLV